MITLVTGATGYIGSRLIQRLHYEGVSLRALVRHAPLNVLENCEFIYGDLLLTPPWETLFRNVTDAYYLVHAMDSSGIFTEKDREAAKLFAEQAAVFGVKRIYYLGALGEGKLSPHLESRHEVGSILKTYAKGVQVVEVRSSIVLGAGSLSFEVIWALVNRLPFMVCPKWVNTSLEPIAERDLLDILLHIRNEPPGPSCIIEVGSNEITTYKKLMQTLAAKLHLTRWMMPVPVLTPKLSSLWLAFVTPYRFKAARILVESALCPTVTVHNEARGLLGKPLMSVDEALDEAIRSQEACIQDVVEGKTPKSEAPFLLYEENSTQINKSFDTCCGEVEAIGGKKGWYRGNFFWKIRGWIDRALGGPGMGRGRPETPKEGESLDCWKIEKWQPGLYLLRAEMKVPGKAWLRVRLTPQSNNITTLEVTAFFLPNTLWGTLYWYALKPVHKWIFCGITQGIKRGAER